MTDFETKLRLFLALDISKEKRGISVANANQTKEENSNV